MLANNFHLLPYNVSTNFDKFHVQNVSIAVVATYERKIVFIFQNNQMITDGADKKRLPQKVKCEKMYLKRVKTCLTFYVFAYLLLERKCFNN